MRFVIFAFLILNAFSGCSDGCLMCSFNDICLFCDTTGYYLNGIQCKAFTNNNCLYWSQSGTCLSCADFFYLDVQTTKCLAVAAESVIANCKAYSGPNVCSNCKTNYILSSGSCKIVSKVIDCCSSYNPSNQAICLMCSSGCILNLDSSACLRTGGDSSCAGYSMAKCDECATGYYLDYNILTDTVYDFLNPVKSTNYLYWDASKNYDQGTFLTCKKTTALNCKTFLSFDKCRTCLDNFFLDTTTSNCLQFPPQVIMNCEIYINANACSKCKDGFYLIDSQTCGSADPTATCLKFDSTKSNLICILCQSQYYLDPSNICVKRVKSAAILSCDLTEIKSDSCFSCKDGFIKTDDALACLLQITNCQIYAPSTSATSKLVCQQCNSGLYYINSSSNCELGNVQSCDIYQTDTGGCLKCLNGFYLASSLCVAHPQINNCSIYNAANKGICDSCSTNFSLFKKKNTCLAVNNIQYCQTYSSVSECLDCQNGYSVDQNKQCVAIQIPQFCLKLSGTSCILCQINYYLTNGVCFPLPSYFDDGCALNTGTGLNDISVMNCQYCKSNQIPFNFINSFVCMPSSTIPLISVITNCIRYSNPSVGVYNCQECSNNYVILTDGTCAASCPSNNVLLPIEAILTYISVMSYTYFINRIRVCSSSPPTPNCAVAFPRTKITLNSSAVIIYGCRVCQSGYVSVLNSANSINVIQMQDYPTNALIKSPVSAHPEIICSLSSSIVIGSTSQIIANCQYYHTQASNSGCYKCLTGFSGPLVNFSSSTIGYINSCLLINNCVPGVVDGYHLIGTLDNNYNVALGSLYSCHVCTNSMIPFIAVTIISGSITYVMSQTFGLDLAPYQTSTGGYQTNCYLPVAATFGILSTSFSFPLNCGLGVINVSSASPVSALEATFDLPSAGKAAVYCYACSPGYMPVRSLNTNLVAPLSIKSCTPIQSCLSSIWFNSCSQCFTSYSYSYDPVNKMINFAECTLSPDPNNNCFAIDTTVTPKICKYCKTGYILNYDKICEQIQAYMCSKTSLDLNIAFDVAINQKNQFDAGFFLMPNGPGCSSCQTGFVAMKIFTNQYVCNLSPYFSSKIYQSNTKFVQSCLSYYMNSDNTSVACYICDSNFVVSIKGVCYSAYQYSNCIKVDDTVPTNIVCGLCNSGFVVITGVCQMQSISNCSVYGLSSTLTQICNTCVSGYYLNQNICVKSLISKCKTPTGLTKCSVCELGYYIVTLSNTNDYCYPIPVVNNCQVATYNPNTREISCTTCTAGFILSPTVPVESTYACGFPVEIVNCKTYDLKMDMRTGTLKCTECTGSNYLQDPLCLPRLNTPSACELFSITSDQCLRCISGYYVSTDKTKCVINPTGIAGCINYTSMTACSKCSQGAYLDANLCKTVPVQNQVNNCKFYSSITDCSECSFGYFLVMKACLLATATNCLTYTSLSTCGSCPVGMGLKQQSNGLSCVNVDSPGCVNYNINFPFACLTCGGDYYVSDGICKLVSTPINFCKIYDSSSTCNICSIGYILSEKKDACLRTTKLIQMFDPQCSIMSVNSNPVCAKCASGFYFSNNACTQCKSDLNCYACSNSGSSTCIMCKLGYYQLKNGTCVLTSTSNSSNSTNFTIKTEKIEKFYVLLFLSFMILKI